MKSRVCGRCGKIVSGKCDCKQHIERESTSAKGYGRKWQRFRQRVYRARARSGAVKCGICSLVFGNESPHADHIIPVKGEGDPLFYDESNIQFLHAKCHGLKTKGDVRQGLTR